jgi:hypothetical protein
VNDVLAWMESSALGHFMRESGPWTYALVNLTHILGVAALFGAVLILDLRLVGLWHRTPLAALTTVSSPLAAIGFAVAATSGIGLLASNATEYIGNPFLAVKFPAIGLGLANAILVRRSLAWRAHRDRALTPRERRRLAMAGALSLCSWLTAIAAGRLIGYW